MTEEEYIKIREKNKKTLEKVKKENFALGLPITYREPEMNGLFKEYGDGKIEYLDFETRITKTIQEGKRMKGKKEFTDQEIQEISNLIQQKCNAPKSKQKAIRDKIRAKNFYWEDFSSQKIKGGYTVEHFLKYITRISEKG